MLDKAQRGSGRTPALGRPPAHAIDARARRPFNLTSVRLPTGDDAPVAEQRLLALPFADLISFSRPDCARRPILVVAPLAGGFAILLRDLVLNLVRSHGTVAVTDWFDARYVPLATGRFGFEDNVLYVARMIRALQPPPHVIAVCQGVVPALVATAFVSEAAPRFAPASLTLVAGPVDPTANMTRVVRLIRSRPLRWFADNVIEAVPAGFPGEGRLVYPKRLQLQTFLGYLARHMMLGNELLWKFLNDDGEDRMRFPFAKLVLAMMDLSAEFFLEHARLVFQERALEEGSLRIGGSPVDFGVIARTALMTIEGGRDDLAGPGQTRAAHGLCRGVPDERRRHLTVSESGHFSLFHGEICRSRVMPEVIDFLAGAERRPRRPRGASPRRRGGSGCR